MIAASFWARNEVFILVAVAYVVWLSIMLWVLFPSKGY